MTLIPFPLRIMVPLPWGYSTPTDLPYGLAMSSCDPKLGSRGGLGIQGFPFQYEAGESRSGDRSFQISARQRAEIWVKGEESKAWSLGTK